MKWLAWSLFWLVALPATAWMALAVHFDLPWPRWRSPLAVGLALVALGLCTLPPLLVAVPAWLVAFGVVLGWWLSLRPRMDRQWAPDVARLPRAIIDGDMLRVRDLRNFDYGPAGEPLPRYEDRTFDLARLESIDYFVCHWAGPTIAHTMVSFGFGGDQYLCLSVEARKERGERYSALRSFFRHFELICVLGDERDLVRLRAAIRKEQVYIYRVRSTPERRRAYLLACLERVEALAARPEWYNAFASNCTTNLFDLVERPPRGCAAFEVLLGGLSPRYLYRQGAFASHVAFEELKAQSLLRADLALEGGSDFSRRIRTGLVLPRPAAEPTS